GWIGTRRRKWATSCAKAVSSARPIEPSVRHNILQLAGVVLRPLTAAGRAQNIFSPALNQTHPWCDKTWVFGALSHVERMELLAFSRISRSRALDIAALRPPGLPARWEFSMPDVEQIPSLIGD